MQNLSLLGASCSTFNFKCRQIILGNWVKEVLLLLLLLLLLLFLQIAASVPRIFQAGSVPENELGRETVQFLESQDLLWQCSAVSHLSLTSGVFSASLSCFCLSLALSLWIKQSSWCMSNIADVCAAI